METPIEAPPLPTSYYENRLLSRVQIQQMLGISRTTIHRYLKEKDPLPSYLIRGRRKFNLAKTIWWIEKHEELGGHR